MGIFRGCQSGEHELIGSSALSLEIDRISNPEKKQIVRSLYALTSSHINFDEAIEARAKDIAAQSKIRAFDSYHIALAERAGADILITTDDKLEKMASRLQLNVEVINPLKFMMKYIYGGE